MLKVITNRWHRILMVLLISIFLAIGLGFVVNTAVLKKKIVEDAELYTRDVNEHQADMFESYLKDKIYFLGEFSDTIANIPPQEWTQELLHQKAAVFSMECIVILDRGGGVFPWKEEHTALRQWLEKNTLVFEDPQVCVVPEHGLVFTVPVLHDGAPSGKAVMGITGTQGMKYIFQEQNESEINLLLDGSGGLIAGIVGSTLMSPEQLSRARQHLEEEFRRGPRNALEELCGKYTVVVLNGKKSVVSVHKLSINDWIEISIAPWDIETKYKLHLWAYFFLCILFAVVSFAMLGYMMLLNKKARKLLNKVAYYDFVTDGTTDQGFCSQALELLNWQGWTSYSILYFDVCSFEYINERWGFDQGNLSLRHIYSCMKQSLRTNELVARSENDHFFLLLRSIKEQEITERVMQMLTRINTFGTQTPESYQFEFAIGAYIIKQEYDNVLVLQDHARRAAKFHDKAQVCTFYNDKIIDRINWENRLNTLFDESLKNGDFQVYLQPKVYLQQDRPCAAEALVRWIHPEEGMISPSDFVPIFEDNGRICELDLYVFEQVCRLVSQWREQGRCFSEISVNISKEHLRETCAHFQEEYHRLKRQYNIPDGVIQLELTETSILHAHQFPRVAQVIGSFHEYGFTCALDDFGFGYSSLSMLKDFCIDTIKLDRTFFVNESRKSRIVVENMIRLAHDMDIEIVAEGIEEREQVELLRDLGCDLIQGYYFSKPLPIDEFIIWQDKEYGTSTVRLH